MNRKSLARAVLSVLIGWGVWAGLARASDPSYYPTGPNDPNYYPKTPPDMKELPPGYPPVDSSPKKFPIAQFIFHGRPLGAWSSFNSYSCSSLKSEAGFIFGSCRTFYSEPKLKGAPPSPLPPWAGPESGYRRYPVNDRGAWEYIRPGYPGVVGYPGYGVEQQPKCNCP